MEFTSYGGQYGHVYNYGDRSLTWKVTSHDIATVTESCV